MGQRTHFNSHRTISYTKYESGSGATRSLSALAQESDMEGNYNSTQVEYLQHAVACCFFTHTERFAVVCGFFTVIVVADSTASALAM